MPARNGIPEASVGQGKLVMLAVGDLFALPCHLLQITSGGRLLHHHCDSLNRCMIRKMIQWYASSVLYVSGQLHQEGHCKFLRLYPTPNPPQAFRQLHHQEVPHPTASRLTPPQPIYPPSPSHAPGKLQLHLDSVPAGLCQPDCARQACSPSTPGHHHNHPQGPPQASCAAPRPGNNPPPLAPPSRERKKSSP